MAGGGIGGRVMLRDELTGVYIRAYLWERLQEEAERARRYGKTFSLLFVDLDHFKSVNDAFGHPRGDRVLAEFAQRLQDALRSSDLMFRYGGDEFVILLPCTSREQACVVADHLRETVRRRPFGEPPLFLTLSVGVATFPEEAQTIDALVEKADLRLFEAKRRGRDCVVAEDPPQLASGLLTELPRLLERDGACHAFQRFLNALAKTRRGMFLITGPPGSGRSRFLSEVAQVARLQGYEVFFLCGERALQGRPREALSRAWKDWTGQPPSFVGLEHFTQAVQAVLEERGRSCLLLAVDDMAFLDRATLDLLYHFLDTSSLPVLALACTLDPRAVARPLPVFPLRETVELYPLSREGIRVGLRMLLQWEPPEGFLEWFHRETSGLPAFLYKGLSYLIERGIMVRGEGTWTFARDFTDIPLGERLGLHARMPFHNLPIIPTSFVDREREVEEVKGLLRIHRLVTLLGPGGIGKTRLALQVATEVLSDYADGVYYVPLTSIASADLLLPGIAEALRFSFYTGEAPKVQLFNYLREKELLLLLDGFEHLVEQAGLVNEILSTAPAVRILVTSQERLGLQGEAIFTVQGLPYPEREVLAAEEFGAVQLFVQRARSVRSGFTLSAEEKPWVARICQLLEGMPLGIELAASWVSTLSCQEIAREIAQGLDFLTAPLRDLPERHRSLRAVFDRSWSLLREGEQKIFRRMAIFRGGFRREAAEAVAGATLPTLATLVDKSLLWRTPAGRYEMLEVVRQYAESRLLERPTEVEEVRKRHARYYADFMAQHEDTLESREQRLVLLEIGEELENARRAWDWAIEEMAEEEIGRLAGGLAFFYEMRGWFQEGWETFARAVERLRLSDRPPNLLWGRLLARQGGFAARLGQYREARPLLEEALDILRQHKAWREQTLVLNDLGDLAYFLGDYTGAKQFYQESLEISQKIGALWRIPHSLNYLGAVAFRQGNYAEARQLCRESLVISQRIGDQYGAARSLNSLGAVAYTLGEYEEARQLYQQSLLLCREIGDRYGITRALNNLGAVAYQLGDYGEAVRLNWESLAIKRESGDRRGIAFSLTNLGKLAYLREDYDEARRLLQESLDIFAEFADPVGMATALDYLGNVLQALGKQKEAQEHFYRALQMAMDIQAFPLVLDILVGLAALQVRVGKTDRAMQLLHLVWVHPAGEQESRMKAERLLEEVLGRRAGEFLAEGGAEEMRLEEVVGELLENFKFEI